MLCICQHLLFSTPSCLLPFSLYVDDFQSSLNVSVTMVLPSSSSFMTKRSMQQFTLLPLSLLLFSMSHLASNCKCAVKFTNNIPIPIFGYFQFISTNDDLKILFLLHQMAHMYITPILVVQCSPLAFTCTHIHTYIHTQIHTNLNNLWKVYGKTVMIRASIHNFCNLGSQGKMELRNTVIFFHSLNVLRW